MTTLCSIACETVHITTGRITVFGTQSTIEVTYPTLVHTFLYSQVKHCFFFTIIDTSNTSIIRLTIVSTNLINHIHRQVLQTSLDITTKELLTIDHQFLDFLTVDLHITVIVNYLDNFYQGLAAVELKQLYAGVAPVTNAPFEIILVEVANEADVQTVLDIFQARVDRECGDSTYPENAEAWMNNCRITSRGNYVFLAVLMGSAEIPSQFILD